MANVWNGPDTRRQRGGTVYETLGEQVSVARGFGSVQQARSCDPSSLQSWTHDTGYNHGTHAQGLPSPLDGLPDEMLGVVAVTAVGCLLARFLHLLRIQEYFQHTHASTDLTVALSFLVASCMLTL